MALQTAPGVLAVEVDYTTGKATIGTNAGRPPSKQAVLAALESIGYRGRFGNDVGE